MQRIPVKLSLLVFCVAAGMKYDINFGVRIPVGELLAFVSLPFLLQSIRWSVYQTSLFSASAVLVVWIFAVCLSDFINGTSLNFFVKGLAKPIWCALWMFFFIGVLARDYRALYAYPAGSVVAGLQNYFFPQAWTEYYFSRGDYNSTAFGSVPLITTLILFIAVYAYRKSPLISAIAYFLCAFFFVYLGAQRGTTAICLLVFLTLAYMWSLRLRQIRIRKIPVGRVILILIFFFGASYAIFEAYVLIASHGWMGEMQQQKLEAQSDTIFGNSLLGLILDGRTAVFAAMLAIMDRPFLGFGSWQANFLSEYYFEAFSIVGTSALEYQRLGSSGISAGVGHSIFFSAWVENGLLAAISLAIIGYWMFKELLNVVFKDNPFAPLFISMALFFFWGYFFSPFGVESRLVIGLFLALKITQFCEYPPTMGYKIEKI
jgi:hypothetical protein